MKKIFQLLILTSILLFLSCNEEEKVKAMVDKIIKNKNILYEIVKDTSQITDDFVAESEYNRGKEYISQFYDYVDKYFSSEYIFKTINKESTVGSWLVMRKKTKVIEVWIEGIKHNYICFDFERESLKLCRISFGEEMSKDTKDLYEW